MPILIWAGLIFYLSSLPGLRSNLPWPYDFILRKIAHIFEFAILFLLFIRVFENGHHVSNKKALLLAFVLTLFYAISDEVHQAFIADRVANLTDIAIDSLGVLLIIWMRIRQFS